MTGIVYKPLSSLAPVELNYNYNNNENLKRTYNLFNNGLRTSNLFSTKNYQDVTFNNYSCFILTTSVFIDAVFDSSKTLTIGQVPGSVILQSRGSIVYYVKHNTVKNTLQATLTSASIIYIDPVPGTDEAELKIENNFLQVEKNYPYTVKLNEKTLDPEEIYRQRFKILQQNNIIMFKTLTDSGYRYLALNNDNTLRATGLILNESIVNDYVFHCIPVTTLNLSAGFIPSNQWVTYYYDIENRTNNKNLAIKKQFSETFTNFLIDFPFEEITTTNTTKINIANLKTNLTPTGGPGAGVVQTITPAVVMEERYESFSVVYNGITIQGYLYMPRAVNEIDVILAFHGTTSSDTLSMSAAQTTLLQLRDSVGIENMAIISVAYPQENLLFGDNIINAEAALLWVLSNPKDFLEVSVNRVFLFGHSQGGYLVTRLNTMYKTDGIIASSPGPIDLVIRCTLDETLPVQNRSRECQLLFSEYGSATTNPDEYYDRSLIEFTTGHLSKALYIQGLKDSTFQVERFLDFEAKLLNCTDCASYAIVKVLEGGHAAATQTEEGKQAIFNFLNNTLTFTNI